MRKFKLSIMAEKITKSITEKKPKFPKEKPIFLIPEKKIKERSPKIVKVKNQENKRGRAGNIQSGLNPYGKPQVIRNGEQIG